MVCLFVGLLSKSKGLILRMTGCLHCLFQLDSFNDAFSSGESDFEPSTVVRDSAVKAAVNFVATCINHTLYLCGRNSSAEEVRMLQDDIARTPTQTSTDEPAKPVANPGGYVLLLPGKRLHITALNEKKKFRDMGNKQGAVDTITSLEQDGLGIVISTETQGTAKVGGDKSILNFYHTNTRVSERIFFPIFPSTGVLCIIDVTIIIPWHLFPSLFFVRSNTHSSRLT